MNLEKQLPDAQNLQRDALRVAVVSVFYFVAQWLAFLFPDEGNLLVTIWPAGGIGLAALLLNRRRLWLPILLGMFLVGTTALLLSGRPFFASLGFMTANVLESFLCAWVITRWGGDRVRFARVREVILLIFAATVVNGFTALIGAGTAWLVNPAPFWDLWANWWIADFVGILIVALLIVAWSNPAEFFQRRDWKWHVESVIALMLWGWLVWLVFDSAWGRNAHFLQPYTLIPLLIYICVRFELRGSTTALLVMALIFLNSSVVIEGPLLWGGHTFQERTLLAQGFLGTTAMVSYLVTAALSERKRVEESLLRSQELYQDVVERQGVGVYRIRVRQSLSWQSVDVPPYEYEFINDEYCRLTGASRAEHLADPTMTLRMVHPDDYPDFAAKNEESDQNLTPFVWEGRMIIGGEVRWVHYSSRPRNIGDGDRILTGILMDITDRKQAEEALRASEERFRSLIVSAPDAVYVVGQDGKIVFANAEASRLLGYSPDELTGMPVENLLSPNAREAHVASRAKYMQEPRSRLMGTQTHLVVLHKNGAKISVDIKLSPIETEAGMQVLVFMRDITELKHAQKELQQSHEMYQDLVERQGVGVYRIRVKKYQSWEQTEQSHYEYEFVNDEYCRLTGATREEHFADPTLTLKLIHPEDFPSFAKKNEESDLTNEPFVWEGRMIIHGEVRWMYYASRARHVPEIGEVWTGILMDITARKQAEEVALRMTNRWSSAYQAAAEMGASLKTEQVYSAIHHAVQDIMPCPTFIVWLCDTLLVRLVGSYVFENGQRLMPSPYRADYCLGNWIAQNHRSVLLNSRAEITSSGIPCELPEEAPLAESVLAVPMWVKGEIIGILSVQSGDVGVYSRDDMQLLEMLAGHLAIAIENARLYEEVRRLALTDQLTGIFNRTFFEVELLRMELGRDFPVSIIIADLDNLKKINDVFGHARGDALIQSTAKLLQEALRASEILARIGGDEFAVVLPHTDAGAVQEVLSRIHDRIMQQNDAYPDMPVQLSIGVATAERGSLIMEAFKSADRAMYADKVRRKGAAR
jgi:diguanylate cyclase (GGDEF)-like protein/PAS domain S-box-containing protein